MKNNIALALIIMSVVGTNGQTTLPFRYEPYFSAVIVHNADSSAQWYSALFGLKVKNEIRDSVNGVKVIILESSAFLLEILEMKGSLVPAMVLAGSREGTRIQGHFKIGFKVHDMDACLKQLARLKINILHVWIDSSSKKRNFLVNDPDGNLVQFFE